MLLPSIVRRSGRSLATAARQAFWRNTAPAWSANAASQPRADGLGPHRVRAAWASAAAAATGPGEQQQGGGRRRAAAGLPAASTTAVAAAPARAVSSAAGTSAPAPVQQSLDHLRQLSEEQLAAVTAPLGTVRVIAGPGSGKVRGGWSLGQAACALYVLVAA